MRNIIRILTILSLVLFLNGFVTITDSISAKSTEQSKVYEKSYDAVWNAIVDIVRTSELDLVSTNRESGQIVAREKVDALSYGDNVTIFVEKQESGAKIKVGIESDAMATFVSSQNWGTYILGKLDTKLR